MRGGGGGVLRPSVIQSHNNTATEGIYKKKTAHLCFKNILKLSVCCLIQCTLVVSRLESTGMTEFPMIP